MNCAKGARDEASDLLTTIVEKLFVVARHAPATMFGV